MIYTKSKFVKQPCQLQEFVSSRGIPREQPEIVRYYNNNYKGVDYVDQLTKNIKFPGRCTRWTTRMFIYFMQVILVNGFSLMKLLHPEYKEIKITDYIESIIDQMKINLTKYEIKATPRKIEGCNQPVSPIKEPVIQLWEVELLFLVYYVSNYILKYFATSNADDKFQYIISSWRLFMNYSLTQEGQKYDFDRIRPQSTIQSRYLIFQKGKIEITTCNKRTAMTKINAVGDVQGRSTNSLNKLRQF
ncbi:piggyBac_transposable element-derived protein [Hexamita inflata]|uniref:PiggyBac transposable element-derived protein n=1 Tax=Hexamita inflata TaxID=28002 RepID=A0AA86NHE4_9EUKA|nr:piggyBac transposable element-derived protein [Hexamita inflata]